MEWINVPRVHASEFRPKRLGRQPRVILENARGWRALQLWTPDYLKTIAGPTEVSVRETIGPPRNMYQNLAEGGRTTFAQYLDWVLEIASGSDFRDIVEQSAGDVSSVVRAVSACEFERSYYLDARLRALSNELLQDIGVPSWYLTDPVDIFFWCGVLGTSSGLHFDLKPNCNVQIVGQKQFILCEPSQASRLYRFPGGAHCRFDPNLSDFEAFPLARRVRFWRCLLQPGESLYIPVGWFHQVTVMSPWAVNVNFFWRRPFPQGAATPTLWRLILRRGWGLLRAGLGPGGPYSFFRRAPRT